MKTPQEFIEEKRVKFRSTYSPLPEEEKFLVATLSEAIAFGEKREKESWEKEVPIIHEAIEAAEKDGAYFMKKAILDALDKNDSQIRGIIRTAALYTTASPRFQGEEDKILSFIRSTIEGI